MLAKINRAGVSVVISNQRIIVGHPKHVLHWMFCKKNTCTIERERVDAAKYKLRLF